MSLHAPGGDGRVAVATGGAGGAEDAFRYLLARVRPLVTKFQRCRGGVEASRLPSDRKVLDGLAESAGSLAEALTELHEALQARWQYQLVGDTDWRDCPRRWVDALENAKRSSQLHGIADDGFHFNLENYQGADLSAVPPVVFLLRKRRAVEDMETDQGGWEFLDRQMEVEAALDLGMVGFGMDMPRDPAVAGAAGVSGLNGGFDGGDSQQIIFGGGDGDVGGGGGESGHDGEGGRRGEGGGGGGGFGARYDNAGVLLGGEDRGRQFADAMAEPSLTGLAGAAASAPTAAVEVEEDDIPEEFCDPVTFEVMLEPVRTPSGIVFEEETIVEFIDTTGKCPITLQPLSRLDLQHDYELRARIMKFSEQIGLFPGPADPMSRAPQFRRPTTASSAAADRVDGPGRRVSSPASSLAAEDEAAAVTAAAAAAAAAEELEGPKRISVALDAAAAAAAAAALEGVAIQTDAVVARAQFGDVQAREKSQLSAMAASFPYVGPEEQSFSLILDNLPTSSAAFAFLNEFVLCAVVFNQLQVSCHPSTTPVNFDRSAGTCKITLPEAVRFKVDAELRNCGYKLTIFDRKSNMMWFVDASISMRL